VAELRPLTPADADAVFDVQVAAFAEPGEAPPADRGPGLRRILHLAGTDPGGAWVATEDGTITGAALALVREGLWGLSLLVVDPERQSSGTGTALLRRALEHGGSDVRGGIILATEDPRALRVYARAGFEVRPVMEARGVVRRRPDASPRVRPGRWPEDTAIVDAAGRAVRGATHAREIPNYLAAGNELLVHADGGFAVAGGGVLRVLAAHDEGAARELFETVLQRLPDGDRLDVWFLDAQQQWAFEVAVQAGLDLCPAGAIFVRGDVGPLRPYIPSGPYL
jgi:GNAT superfamily N-acetyltransferase